MSRLRLRDSFTRVNPRGLSANPQEATYGPKHILSSLLRQYPFERNSKTAQGFKFLAGML
jgi:hypothetical protein